MTSKAYPSKYDFILLLCLMSVLYKYKQTKPKLFPQLVIFYSFSPFSKMSLQQLLYQMKCFCIYSWYKKHPLTFKDDLSKFEHSKLKQEINQEIEKMQKETQEMQEKCNDLLHFSKKFK